MTQGETNGDSAPSISSGHGKVCRCSIRGREILEFSYHALYQMRDRGLTEEQVIQVIREPEETGLPTPGNRYRFRRYKTPRKAVDVVFEESHDRVIVVTAMKVTLNKKRSRPHDDSQL